MNKGWIKLHRKLLDCALWESNESFDKRSAWIDLLLLCNHEDREIIFNDKPMIIHRGQYLTSVRKLSARWQWSKDRTLNFLKTLQKLGMLTKESNNTRTLLTVVNYEVYQGGQDTNKDTDSYTDTDTIKDTHKDTDSPQTRIKELKNERMKEIKKNIYSSNFEEFWKVYPRKADKAKANKCYQARVKEGWSEDELLKAAKAYAESCKKNGTEDKYIKHAATFLSAGTPFTDYLKGSEKNESVGSNESKYDDLAKEILASRGVFV